MAVPSWHYSKGAVSLCTDLPSVNRRAPESAKADDKKEEEREKMGKREMMQNRSRDYISSLSAHDDLLSLDKHRLMQLPLWLNISFTSKFALERRKELLSKQKIT